MIYNYLSISAQACLRKITGAITVLSDFLVTSTGDYLVDNNGNKLTFKD